MNAVIAKSPWLFIAIFCRVINNNIQNWYIIASIHYYGNVSWYQKSTIKEVFIAIKKRYKKLYGDFKYVIESLLFLLALFIVMEKS